MDGRGAQPGTSAEKHALRQRLRAALAGLEHAEMAAASLGICGQVVDWRAFTDARTVMMYVPSVGEPDVRPIAIACARAGKRLCLPRIGWEDRSLTPAAVESLDEGLVETHHGIMEPAPDAEPVDLERVDLILVPGLGFDDAGGRLGRGAGFYDRFLARPERRGVACGIGFACQLVERIPRDDHDVPLDAIITEQGRITPHSPEG